MTGRIRILYVIGTLDVGGAEGQLVQLATRLDQARFEVAVCCLTSSGPYEADLRAAGIRVHVVGFRGLVMFRAPHKVTAQLLRLGRVIRAERPDIVHGYLFWAYVLGTLAARAVGVRHVISSRRSLGHFKASKPHYLAIERLANSMTTLVIANSNAVAEDAIRQERLPRHKVVVIHNGIDAAKYAVTPSAALRAELGEGHPIVTIVANFIHYKGHRDFLAAWPRVLSDCPSAIAVFVGDGPERAECEAWARDHALDRSMRFLGSRRDVPEILAATDILAHPSLEEGFSNAILEAMAAAVPVVATDVGGNREAVRDGETGLLVEPRRPDLLAAAIVALGRDPARARAMGAAARTLVSDSFSVDTAVRRHEDVYTSVVGHGTATKGDTSIGAR